MEVAVDLETKGLIQKGVVPEIICVGWADEVGSNCMEWNESTKEIIQHLANNNTFVYHNSSFDHQILTSYGVKVKKYHDTQLMSYVLQPNATHAHRLEHWGEVLGFPKLDKPWSGKYATEFSEELATYCKTDAELTIKLFGHLKKVFVNEDPEAWEFYNTIELPYSLVIQEMQATGMFVNLPALQALSTTLKGKLGELEAAAIKLYPRGPGQIKKYKKEHPDKLPPQWDFLGQIDGEWHYRQNVTFNPASNAHKAYALRQEGWEATEMTPSGEPKVSKDVLEKLSYPIAEILTEYGTINKIVGSFLEPFYEYTNEKGILRGNFNQTVTLTGRLSSSNPNLQNIPRRGELGQQMRNLITTPSEDICLFNGDLSNIEARMLAWMLDYFVGESSMADTFISGADFHSSNAKAWGVERDVAKTLFFAILYGAGPMRISKSLKKDYMEAKRLIEKLNRAMPAIQQLKEEFWEAARKNNGILHTLLGRRLVYPDILSSDDSVRGGAERQIFNAYIQGSAGDILKVLTLESMPSIRHYGAKIAAAVHDEVLGYVWKEKAQGLCEEMSYIFSSSQLITPVPIVAEFRYGITWGDIH